MSSIKLGKKMIYKEAESYLISHYYRTNNSSQVTSSHWKNIGAHEAQEATDGSVILNGFGFGTFRPFSPIKALLHMHESLMAIIICFLNINNKYLLLSALKVGFKSKRIIDFDLIKQAIALDYILQKIPTEKLDFTKKKTVCIIGDGYSSMGSLIKILFPETRIVFINLGKTILFDLHYFNKIFQFENYEIINTSEDIKADTRNNLFIPAENYQAIEKLEIDLFINIASMQEMDLETINNYFKFIRASKSKVKYFYCCNRHKKILPDGTQIIFEKYPWNNCEFISNENCHWYDREPISRPPFLRKFDGTFQQAIAKF